MESGEGERRRAATSHPSSLNHQRHLIIIRLVVVVHRTSVLALSLLPETAALLLAFDPLTRLSPLRPELFALEPPLYTVSSLLLLPVPIISCAVCSPGFCTHLIGRSVSPSRARSTPWAVLMTSFTLCSSPAMTVRVRFEVACEVACEETTLAPLLDCFALIARASCWRSDS